MYTLVPIIVTCEIPISEFEDVPYIFLRFASYDSQLGRFATEYVIWPPSGSKIVDGGIVYVKSVFVQVYWRVGESETIGNEATWISKVKELFRPVGSTA